MQLVVTVNLDSNAFRLPDGYGGMSGINTMEVRTAIQRALFDMGPAREGLCTWVKDGNGNRVGEVWIEGD
jgi:hypothetical protein